MHPSNFIIKLLSHQFPSCAMPTKNQQHQITLHTEIHNYLVQNKQEVVTSQQKVCGKLNNFCHSSSHLFPLCYALLFNFISHSLPLICSVLDIKYLMRPIFVFFFCCGRVTHFHKKKITISSSPD